MTITKTLRVTGQDRRVESVRLRDGLAFAVLKDGRVVPREVCGLAAGPDAWLQQVEFPCGTCGVLRTARHLQDSSVPGDCDDCADEFWCPSCGGHPDDCDC